MMFSKSVLNDLILTLEPSPLAAS